MIMENKTFCEELIFWAKMLNISHIVGTAVGINVYKENWDWTIIMSATNIILWCSMLKNLRRVKAWNYLFLIYL